MKTTTLSALALVATALPLAAQTATTATAKPPVHHSIPTTARIGGGCVTLPTLSSKIPAVPVGTPCPKALYTLTRTPDVKLDYISPLVGPEVHEALATEKTTYSLIYADTKIGTGELVHLSKNLSVHYTGYLADGTKFDSSVDRGQPITFPYGTHHVIPGWDTGFEGMRVGGKRRLYIPYQLAYGEAGRPPIIPAKSLLVFDMEVVSQADAPPPAPRPTP
ncbi:FKBP-type peptidyl-prolyl cis-trans isomerase, partial [Granulicella sp. S156]|uniref:FKBP-type peptidyl-prolyl cis-trans isomerase n=1 Tax=Granulicella sp. S156 TaxID=1747224 RepID=UPI00131E9EE4